MREGIILEKNKIEILIEKAMKLQDEFKYEEALELFNEVLKINPTNESALDGKKSCEIMLQPTFTLFPPSSEEEVKKMGYSIPVQSLMALPGVNPEYDVLMKKRGEAKTPWEKKLIV